MFGLMAQCDQCGALVPAEHSKYDREMRPSRRPSGWWYVALTRGTPERGEYDFCSLQCLATWSTKHADAEDAVDRTRAAAALADVAEHGALDAATVLAEIATAVERED